MDLTPEATDADLLRKIAAGDAEAFGRLYDRTSRILFSIARRILRDDATAEDLLQDVYVQVWEKAGTFNGAVGKPMTWLITLTRNRAIDRLRSSLRFERLLQSSREEPDGLRGGAEPAGVDPRMNSGPGKLLGAALARLPEEQRESIELAIYGGLSQTEISTRLEAPLGTIKTRIRRGMIELRDAQRPLQP